MGQPRSVEESDTAARSGQFIFLVSAVLFASDPIPVYLSPGGGGGGGTKKNFIRGGSTPRSNPLPFYIPLLAEKIRLSCTLH